MATAQNKYDNAVKMFEAIRDERNIAANTAYRIGTALLTLLNYAAENGEYLSRLKDDVAKGVITFEQGVKALGGVFFGNWLKGVDGACIDAEGLAELAAATVRKNLGVGGDAVMGGSLSSPDFVSGFVGGKGWRIWKHNVTNAAGVEETKYTEEIDELVVRGAMRVFTLVVSQLLGENDNRIFTAMLEVDHYDAETGKVWLSTQNGKLYNPFRKGDYIMVQQYNGMPSEDNGHYITKHYECIVTEAGLGDSADGEDRLDWVTIKAFMSSDGKSAEELITKGDTFCRVDNEADDERKGIIQVMTVGSATPYMDVNFGLKTDPDNALKARLGRLGGLHSQHFGELKGFGLYTNNFYGIGDFRLSRTGESLDQSFEVLRGRFATAFARQTYELSENMLTNAQFLENLEGWAVDADADTKILSMGSVPVMPNVVLMTVNTKKVSIEERDGRNMLRLQNAGLTQEAELIAKPSTHLEYTEPEAGSESAVTDSREVADTVYMSVKLLPVREGTLTIGFDESGEDSTLGLQVVELDASQTQWATLSWSGQWDGTGKFRLHYTGECFVAFVALTTRPLSELQKTVSTQIVQTAENVTILGRNIDATRQSVTDLTLAVDAENEKIYATIDSKVGDMYTTIGLDLDNLNKSLTAYVDSEVNGVNTSLGLRIDGLNEQLTLYAYKLDNNYYTSAQVDVKIGEISQGVVNVNGRVDDLGQDIDDLDGLVSSLNTKYNTLSNNMTSLQGYMEGAFADGLIDESEREAIKTYLNTVENDFCALEADYKELCNNEYLQISSNSAKLTSMQTAFVNLNSAYTNLIAKITTVVAQSTVSTSDSYAVNSLFSTYTSKVKLFNTAVKAAEAAIEKSIYELAIKEAKEFTQTVFTPTKYTDQDNPWFDWEGGSEWQHIGDLWTPSIGGAEYYYPAGTKCTAVAGETYRYLGGPQSSAGTYPNVWEPVSLVAKSATYIFQNGQRISSIAGNFDANGKILEASGILTTATGTTIWNQVGDKLVASINATANTVAITADHIKLNGYVSNSNGSFSVSETGYVTMKDCDVSGKITATSGTIGGFTIGGSSIYTNENAYSGGSGVNSFSASKFFLHASGYSSAFLGFSATNKWAGIGLNTLPSTSATTALARFEDTVVNTSDWTKIGIYLKVAGASTYDDVGKGNCAIYAEQGVYAGFRIGTRLTTSSITLTKMDNLVICYNTSDITVTLPTGCEKGQLIMVRPAGTKGVKVKTTSGYILRDSDSASGGVQENTCGGKWLHFFLYDKYNNRWLMSYSN